MSFAGRLSLSSLLLLLNALLLLLILLDLDCGRHFADFRRIAVDLSLGVSTVNVWVGGCNASLFRWWSWFVAMCVDKALVYLITLSIDDTSAGLVASLEAHFSGQRCHLFIVEDAAVLVSVFDALFF